VRLLVTGGSGFIGTNVIAEALRRKLTVSNFDIAPPRNPAQLPQWRKVDLLESITLAREVAAFRPTHLIHLAARTELCESKGLEFYAANTDGVRNLLSALQNQPDLERVIFASTMLVCRYGYVPRHDCDYVPDTLYGRSKVIGENRVRAATGFSGSWIIVRPTSIWGPWCGPPYHEFFLRVARGRYLQPGSKPIRKALGFVGNVVFQLFGLLETDAHAVHGKTFYLLDYTPTTIFQWATLIQQLCGAPRIRVAPMALMKALAYGGDILKCAGAGSPPLTTFRLRNMTTTSSFDTSSLRDMVGPLPYDLENGVRMTLHWLRETGQLPAPGSAYDATARRSELVGRADF
jgi:nucleoside-diphosphate-sugar epimerase